MIAGEKPASDEVKLWLERQPAPAIFERLFSAALDRLRPVFGVVRVLGYGNGEMERALLGVLLPVAVLMLELAEPPADRVESALVDRGQIVLRDGREEAAPDGLFHAVEIFLTACLVAFEVEAGVDEIVGQHL